MTRAACDLAEKRPSFATEAGLTALHWLVQGYGYEINERGRVGRLLPDSPRRAKCRPGRAGARIQRLVDAAQGTNDVVVETIERCLRHEPD